MKKKTNLIEEAMGSDAGSSMFGGAGGGGGGTFSHTGQKGAMTKGGGSPPYRSMTGVPNAPELTGILAAEEEEAHKAPKRKPFPLETIDEDLVQAYIVLGNAESKMKQCVRYNSVINSKKDKRATLNFLKDKISAIRKMIQNIALELDQINLS